MASELEREIRLREEAAERVGSTLEEALELCGSRQSRDDASAVWLAWMRVNGDVERRHTSGIFIVPPRRGEEEPSLTVYVDSNVYLTDFSARCEIYLARLASAGLRFSRIEFRRSKWPAPAKNQAEPARPRPRTAAQQSPPPLDAGEHREIDELCSKLPEGLHESVSRAMRASYQAQKREHS